MPHGRTPRPERIRVGWAYAKIATLLELDESSAAVRLTLTKAAASDPDASRALARAVWPELARLGLGETALAELYSAMKSERPVSTGGAPTYAHVNAVLGKLVARARANLDVATRGGAVQLVAAVQMLWGRRWGTDLLTLDRWRGYSLPRDLSGSKRLGVLTDRVRKRVSGLSPS